MDDLQDRQAPDEARASDGAAATPTNGARRRTPLVAARRRWTAVDPNERTLAVGATVLAAAMLTCAFVPVPYVIMRPGPLVNVLGKAEGHHVVAVKGATRHATAGELDLTTVSVTSYEGSVSLGDAVLAWTDKDAAVVPRTVVYPDDRSGSEVQEYNRAVFVDSQQTAAAAALRYTGHRVTPVVAVDSLQADGPAAGHLRADDIITAVGDTPTTSVDEVRAAVREHQPGQAVAVKVRRSGATQTVTVRLARGEDGAPMLGVTLRESFDADITVTIDAGPGIGGPSAGAMFATGAVEALTGEVLVGDRHVAGTGTITAAGEVGPISGIAQKIAAARDHGDTLFILPRDNCPEAVRAHAGDMRLAPVDTLGDIVEVLRATRANPRAALPACPS